MNIQFSHSIYFDLSGRVNGETKAVVNNVHYIILNDNGCFSDMRFRGFSTSKIMDVFSNTLATITYKYMPGSDSSLCSGYEISVIYYKDNHIMTTWIKIPGSDFRKIVEEAFKLSLPFS